LIQLHQFNLEESVRLLRMDAEQLALLKEVRLVIERDSEEIVRNFYAHVTTLPRLKAIIDRFPTVEMLKITMKKYLFSLFPESTKSSCSGESRSERFIVGANYHLFTI
jgi:heme-based aerotactic transducer